MTKQKPQTPLTKRKFEDIMTKVFARPSSQVSGESKTGTSESRPSGGYSGKRKSQGRSGDTQG